MSANKSNRGQPAPAAHREAVRRLIDELGEEGAAQRLGMNRNALARIVGALGLRSVTRQLLKERLEKGAGT